MNCTLSNIVIFAVGAAIGSAVTYKIVKNKYERIAEEEISSMREYYKGKYVGPQQSEPISDEKKAEYETLVSEQGYGTYSEEKTTEEVPSMGEPYVISPSEFGELDYDTVSLTYYADGVLADEMDEIIEDVDDIVGLDSLNHFGEYEDDSVFVRNDRMSCDYEILLDSRNYANVKKLYQSHKTED